MPYFIVIGTSGDDDIIGSSIDDWIYGDGGFDTIRGLDGNDILWGEAGDDFLQGGAGNDVLRGDTTSTDNPTGNDLLDGEDGNDRLYGGGGHDQLSGGAGDDELVGDDGSDSLRGDDGTDYLWGGLGDDALFGGAGNDDLVGGDGNDNLFGGPGGDWINGGAGVDMIHFNDIGTGGVSVDLSTGRALDMFGFWDTILDVENVVGMVGNDAITGSYATNVLMGISGDDLLKGGAGDDLLLGDDQIDLTTGQFFPSTVGGVDLIVGGAGYDIMFGGLGLDTADYGAAASGVDVDLATAYASNDGDGSQDEIYQFENITGSNFADILTGDAGANVLNGNGGVDSMTGGAGADIYIVDSTGDIVTELVSEGTDIVMSSVTFNAATATAIGIENVTLTGSAGANVLGNALNNVLTGNSANNGLSGGAGADTLIGGLGNDLYTVDNASDVAIEDAGAGTDRVQTTVSQTLAANVENLTLLGSAGIYGIGNADINIIVGNAGNNIIAGKGGADTLTGGGGNDIFDYNTVAESSYSAYDRIMDLGGDDRIDLSGIDADMNMTGNQAFTLVDAFTNVAGQITMTYNAGGDFTVLAADVDGDGTAEMRIVIYGDHHTFTDFTL